MNNDIKINGPLRSQSNDNGKSVLIKEPVIGIVKDNIDANRTGEIKVYIPNFGSMNIDDSNSWTPVRYAMPYYGLTKPVSTGDGYGEYVGNSHSYGMWFPAPDIGTQVLCIFVNGSIERGYYIGCIPEPTALQMIPAIGAVTGVVLNEGEASSYGASPKLPTTNINTNDKNKANSNEFLKEGKPLHSYHAATFNRQGILRDAIRGPISSSAQRESPSRVAGMSTPGRPIYEGGLKDNEVKGKAASKDNASLKIIGRRGGHTFVMDDGDIEGKDQLMRLRTPNGHQIMMNDSNEVLSIMHSNGLSYIELGKEGTIDIYGTNSINFRTNGDFNIHADRNINLNAKEQVNINSKNLFSNTDESTSFRSGTTFATYSVGNYTIKTDASYGAMASGNASLNSSGLTYINGGRINLNTGSPSLTPDKIKPPTLSAHTDTVYDSEKGYLASPGKLTSIVSRAPAHFPWEAAGKGIAIDIKLDAPETTTSVPTMASDVAPSKTTSPALISTVSSSIKTPLGEATKAVTSQMAVNAATGLASEAVKTGMGIVDTANGKLAVVGALAQTPKELGALLKPGSDIAIQKAIDSGADISKAMPSAVFSGKDGVNNLNALTKDNTAAVNTFTSSLDEAKKKLISTGVLKGNETSTSGATGLVLAGAVMGADNVTKSVGTYIRSLPAIGSTIGESLKSIDTGVNGAIAKLNSVNSLTGVLPTSVGNALNGLTAKIGIPAALGALTSLKGNLSSLAGMGDFAAKTAQSLSSSVESLSNKLFDGIKNSIPKLPSGKLLDLSGPENKIKEVGDLTSGAMNSLTSTANGLMDGIKLPNALTGTNPLSAVATAASESIKGAVNTVTNGTLSEGIGGISKTLSSVGGAAGAIGLTSISANLNSAKALLSGAQSAINGVNKLSSALDKLPALPPAGLDKMAKDMFGSKASELENALKSFGDGIKVPTLASGTVKLDSLVSQSAKLLGNPKIPPIPMGDGTST